MESVEIFRRGPVGLIVCHQIPIHKGYAQSLDLQKSHWKSTRRKIKKTHFLLEGSKFDLLVIALPYVIARSLVIAKYRSREEARVTFYHAITPASINYHNK